MVGETGFSQISNGMTLLKVMQGRAKRFCGKPFCVGGVSRTSAMEAAILHEVVDRPFNGRSMTGSQA
jgi:hypothetical protein